MVVVVVVPSVVGFFVGALYEVDEGNNILSTQECSLLGVRERGAGKPQSYYGFLHYCFGVIPLAQTGEVNG